MFKNYIIGIDWGTTHLRAYLCDISTSGDTHLIAVEKGLGVSKQLLSFEDSLFDCIDPWLKLYGKLPIYLCGQIGSSIGWHEAPYLPCPINPHKIKNDFLSFIVRGHKVSIIPGISCCLGENDFDVMRGEELQILGWLKLNPTHQKGQYLLCLPGTHTKWVLLVDGEIQLFKTAMTGELFDLLSTQSILIQKNGSSFNLDSFLNGANKTLNSELGAFSHSLFSVRSKQLFSKLNENNAASYLSGFLIGSDVRAAINALQWNMQNFQSIEIIGAPHLSDCFAQVLSLKNIKSRVHNVEKITLLGFSGLR